MELGKPFWWRLASVGLLLTLVIWLLLLARQAGELRGRVLSRLCTLLRERAVTLPRDERLELEGALKCLELMGQTSRNAGKLGAFVGTARSALTDGQLTAQEAKTVAAAAREACAGTAP